MRNPEPEIIPPGTRVPPRRETGDDVRTEGRRDGRADDSLDALATLLDDIFHIPGTNIRFGLDAIIGLIPGLGDLISAIASFTIVYAAWQRNLPKATQARMVTNIAIDSIVGAIPFVGDLFDVAWKSNRRNVEILREAERMAPSQRKRRDIGFLLVVLLVLIVLIAIPVFVALWLYGAIFGRTA